MVTPTMLMMMLTTTMTLIRNGTGYWMVGPVDDLSDESFLEDSAKDSANEQLEERLNANLGNNNNNNWGGEPFASLMRGFCLKKIYPGEAPYYCMIVTDFIIYFVVLFLRFSLSGLNSNDDVTCIAMQRRLILCGTLCGGLLIFSADSSDSKTSNTSKSSGSELLNLDCSLDYFSFLGSRLSPPRHSKLEFDSTPLAKLKVSSQAIVQVRGPKTYHEIR